jgi:hypothetical protein
MSVSIPNTEVCILGFRDQSIVKPLWVTLNNLTWAAQEFGLNGYGEIDWLQTITRLYSDTSRPKDPNPDLEFRTFANSDDLESRHSLLSNLKYNSPILLHNQEMPDNRSVESLRNVVFLMASKIIIVEAHIWHEDDAPIYDNYWVIGSSETARSKKTDLSESIFGFFLTHTNGRTGLTEIAVPDDFKSCASNKSTFREGFMSGISEVEANRRNQQAVKDRVTCFSRIAITKEHILADEVGIIAQSIIK